MRKFAAVALLAAACGSTSGAKPAATVPAPSDLQLVSLQTSMTELLERLDVMNDRITRLEKASEERAVTSAPVAAPRAAIAPAASHGAEVSGAPPKRAAPLRSAAIADTYRNAIVMFGKNRYAESRVTFQQVFDADPSGELADNALFWIGETYFASADYNNAIRYYKRVAEEYGDQNKAPDAMYKLAVAYEKTSDLALARTTLHEVIARYPYSAPAASAKSELNRIKY
ncbi:MAG: tol-pal system protein YbgF [Thermoanaerobaculia bacterium]